MAPGESGRLTRLPLAPLGVGALHHLLRERVGPDLVHPRQARCAGTEEEHEADDGHEDPADSADRGQRDHVLNTGREQRKVVEHVAIAGKLNQAAIDLRLRRDRRRKLADPPRDHVLDGEEEIERPNGRILLAPQSVGAQHAVVEVPGPADRDRVPLAARRA